MVETNVYIIQYISESIFKLSASMLLYRCSNNEKKGYKTIFLGVIGISFLKRRDLTKLWFFGRLTSPLVNLNLFAVKSLFYYASITCIQKLI